MIDCSVDILSNTQSLTNISGAELELAYAVKEMSATVQIELALVLFGT